MSRKPEERNKDSMKAAKDNVAQAEPIGKQDPTEPVTEQDADTTSDGGPAAREGKGTATGGIVAGV